MSTVIKVENLSKQYRLGDVGTGTLRDDFKRWTHRIMGKEDPFLKIGEENDRSKKGDSDYVWALRDINFEIEQGDVVGIIGRNGAGKSTLLKILSRTTAPTTGSVRVKGRIASLLEVGTGFHGELSGRENIYLNGAIMGLRKWEIDKKLDEIIDFAGVDRYLDTPVKRYSSGMYVRLAFAVAAHLDPDILIVDEVLAVGDAEFQKKCLGKMKDVSEGQGRTVLFVSHNIQAVSNLCTTGIFMENGRINFINNIESCIKEYFNDSIKRSLDKVAIDDRQKRTSGKAFFLRAYLMKNAEETWEFTFGEEIRFNFEIKTYQKIESLLIFISLRDTFTGETITNFKKVLSSKQIPEGVLKKLTVSLPGAILKPKQYALYFAIGNMEAKEFYDVLDKNINLPNLIVKPSSMDVHEFDGFFTAPFEIVAYE